MNISNTLREQVQVLEREMDTHRNSVLQLETQRNNAQTEYESIYSQMNIREKYFGGWFGGDKSIVQRSNGLEESILGYDLEINQTKAVVQTTDSKINEVIKSYLVQNDSTYQQLHAVFENVEEVSKAVDLYMRRINFALSEISDAQGMETFDLFTKSTAISVLSYMENSEAQEAVNVVKNGTKPFQDSLQKYNGFLKSTPIAGLGNVNIEDGIDLMFDFIFDGFDFMSLFTLSSLSNAESELWQLHSKVSEVQGK